MSQISVTADDAHLVALMQLDRTDAFAALYDRHSHAVYRHACRFVGSGAPAEDVTQDTFVSAWRARGQFACERGSVRGWLLTIARNRAIDSLRHRSHSDHALDETYERAGMDCTETEVLGREQADAITLALLGLPSEQRRVIELSYAHGLSQSEIAARLQLPLGTVKSRARLGLEKLRVELTPTQQVYA
ncbi:sigma-70 family RNA polymerase sigma factor [Solirubrobacter taibaiensis]|nr:sigma-70 family RNA polymerase sigma factor [Solirubrobacter taibaiensis]